MWSSLHFNISTMAEALQMLIRQLGFNCKGMRLSSLKPETWVEAELLMGPANMKCFGGIDP